MIHSKAHAPKFEFLMHAQLIYCTTLELEYTQKFVMKRLR